MGPDDWEQALQANPKMLWGVVADVVKAVKAGEGERKTGRRPGATVTSLDELYSVIFPTAYSGQPFPQAFSTALGDRSQRAFAVKVGIHQATICRLASGKLEPTLEVIERIAGALGVPPTYFSEYRALKLSQIVTDALLANPELTAEVARRLAGARS